MTKNLFQRIISPITPEVFFRDYYEKKPLFIPRSNTDYYEDYFSRNSVFDFLDSPNIVFPKVRMWSGGAETPPQNFTKPMGGKGYQQNVPVIDKEAITHLFLEKKHSVLINSAQDDISEIKDFCKNISSTFHAFVQANIYNTPKNSFCFDYHVDKHDVMILQLSGGKQWKIFDQPYFLPYADEKTEDLNKRRENANCLLDIELMAGDFLYIPRGYIHEVHSKELHSMHATVGLFPRRWRDVLYGILDNDSEMSILKRSVPLAPDQAYALNQSKEAFKRHIMTLVERGLDKELNKIDSKYDNTQSSYSPVHRIESAFISQASQHKNLTSKEQKTIVDESD